jgi:valyl-tRNA synthetase
MSRIALLAMGRRGSKCSWRIGLRAMSVPAMTAVSGSYALPPEIRRRVRDQPLELTYDPASVEAGWQDYWQESIADKARHERRGVGRKEKNFSILLPPPNVTGALHIGHALTITIQDALARWHHMRGYNVQWIPGLDHAGIATQTVVERKIVKEEGKSKHDLGRDEFLQRVWAWNAQYGGRIMNQVNQLGAVINQDEMFFTLDEKRCEIAFSKIRDTEEKTNPVSPTDPKQ